MEAVEGRTFLVTGAASGIGRCLVGRLHAGGGRVMGADVDAAALEVARSEDGWPDEAVVTRVLDVRDAEAWDGALAAIVTRWGGLDVLVNNAGVIAPAWLVDVEIADLHRQIDVNLKGTLLGTRAAARHMVERGGGHVVNVASLTALAPTPGMTVYSASKFAIRGFSLGVAQELAPKGVFVTVVEPDGVDTPMGRREAHYEEAALTFSAGRLLTPEEVADAIVATLARRPLEITVPRSRGWLSWLAGSFPVLAARLEPAIVRQGLARQRRFREGRG